MKKPDFKADELNMKGAYNGKRYLYKEYHSGKERAAVKSDTTAESKAGTDNDLLTIRCRCGIITLKTEGFHSRNVKVAVKVNMGMSADANLRYNNCKRERSTYYESGKYINRTACGRIIKKRGR